MLDRALEELGLDRRRMYVTNAVKHFKFERRGKVRLHRSPNPAEQRACRLWLEGELARIRPDVVVCLGAIAARNVLGTKFGLMKQRGTWQALADGTRAFATVHPSWILRQRDSESRDAAYRGFVADLALLLDSDRRVDQPHAAARSRTNPTTATSAWPITSGAGSNSRFHS